MSFVIHLTTHLEILNQFTLWPKAYDYAYLFRFSPTLDITSTINFIIYS